MDKSIIRNNSKKEENKILNKRSEKNLSKKKKNIMLKRTIIIKPEYAYFDLEKSNLYQRRKKKRLEGKKN